MCPVAVCDACDFPRTRTLSILCERHGSMATPRMTTTWTESQAVRVDADVLVAWDSIAVPVGIETGDKLVLKFETLRSMVAVECRIMVYKSDASSVVEHVTTPIIGLSLIDLVPSFESGFTRKIDRVATKLEWEAKLEADRVARDLLWARGISAWQKRSDQHRHKNT